MARAPIVMPSRTRSANSLRITRSLNVPGSPSSALQTMYLLSLFSAAQKFHFMPVGKPAPPRPLRLAADTVSMMSGRDIARAALRPASGSIVAKVRALVSVLTVISVTPHPARRQSATIARASSGVTRVWTWSLTSSAGP